MSRPAHWRRATLAALLLGCMRLAYSAPDTQPCGEAGCSAARIDAAVIKEAVREAARGADHDAFDLRRSPGTATLKDATPPNPASVWDRRIGGSGEREAYNCALSFGVGGTLGSDRFLATRVLGRTKVWRDE